MDTYFCPAAIASRVSTIFPRVAHAPAPSGMWRFRASMGTLTIDIFGDPLRAFISLVNPQSTLRVQVDSARHWSAELSGPLRPWHRSMVYLAILAILGTPEASETATRSIFHPNERTPR